MAWMRKDIQSSQKSMSIDKKLISGMSLDQDTSTLQGDDPQEKIRLMFLVFCEHLHHLWTRCLGFFSSCLVRRLEKSWVRLVLPESGR
jgi:hypothetical protein